MNNNVDGNGFQRELEVPECIELFFRWLRTDEGRDFLRGFYAVHRRQRLLIGGHTVSDDIRPSIHQMYITARLQNGFAPREIVAASKFYLSTSCLYAPLNDSTHASLTHSCATTDPMARHHGMEAALAHEASRGTNMAQFVQFLGSVLGQFFINAYFAEVSIILALLRERGHLQDNGFVNEHIRQSIIAMYVSARSRRSFTPTSPQAVAAQFSPPDERGRSGDERPSRVEVETRGALSHPVRGQGHLGPPSGPEANASVLGTPGAQSGTYADHRNNRDGERFAARAGAQDPTTAWDSYLHPSSGSDDSSEDSP